MIAIRTINIGISTLLSFSIPLVTPRKIIKAVIPRKISVNMTGWDLAVMKPVKKPSAVA